ncbi:MAG TPA: hypothetical protein VJ914_16385 [Pseudonocardiaceae bacterium]|nr:hypothetical protein [Pseudonocardiaceae bacterium]
MDEQADMKAAKRAVVLALAVMVASWAGILTLTELCTVWPHDSVLQIVLAAWILAAVLSIMIDKSIRRMPRTRSFWLIAPALPVLWLLSPIWSRRIRRG